MRLLFNSPESRVAKLMDDGFNPIDLATLIHHWASMNNEVPATIKTLNMRNGLGHRIIDVAISNMREMYEDVEIEVVSGSGQVLWKHGDRKKQGWEYIS